MVTNLKATLTITVATAPSTQPLNEMAETRRDILKHKFVGDWLLIYIFFYLMYAI